MISKRCLSILATAATGGHRSYQNFLEFKMYVFNGRGTCLTDNQFGFGEMLAIACGQQDVGILRVDEQPAVVPTLTVPNARVVGRDLAPIVAAVVRTKESVVADNKYALGVRVRRDGNGRATRG